MNRGNRRSEKENCLKFYGRAACAQLPDGTERRKSAVLDPPPRQWAHSKYVPGVQIPAESGRVYRRDSSSKEKISEGSGRARLICPLSLPPARTRVCPTCGLSLS